MFSVKTDQDYLDREEKVESEVIGRRSFEWSGGLEKTYSSKPIKKLTIEKGDRYLQIGWSHLHENSFWFVLFILHLTFFGYI
jgi:hypothetical protein